MQLLLPLYYYYYTFCYSTTTTSVATATTKSFTSIFYITAASFVATVDSVDRWSMN